MNHEQIIVWLEERRLRAMCQHLGDFDKVVEAAQARLDALYEQVIPPAEREIIERSIAEDCAERARIEESRRKFGIFHIIEKGEQSHIAIENPPELRHLAIYLRRYQRGEHGAQFFADAIGRERELSSGEYEDMVNKYIAEDGAVCGAFDIDFDHGRLSTLDRSGVKAEYALKDISAAAYASERKSTGSERRRQEIFSSKLEGKMLNGQPQQLTEQNVSFSDSIEEMDGKLNFYMDVVFDADAIFGTHVMTYENADWINVYADYDIRNRQVCDALDIALHRGDGGEEALTYRLSAEEKAIILSKMEAYCIKASGITLEERCVQEQQEQRDPEMGMG